MAINLHPILVIEDDPNLRAMLRIMLERTGSRPTLVGSGQAALPLLRSAVYALLLVDLHLPDISGADSVHAAQQLQPGLPAVLMSGQDWDSLDPTLHTLPISCFPGKTLHTGRRRPGPRACASSGLGAGGLTLRRDGRPETSIRSS